MRICFRERDELEGFFTQSFFDSIMQVIRSYEPPKDELTKFNRHVHVALRCLTNGLNISDEALDVFLSDGNSTLKPLLALITKCQPLQVKFTEVFVCVHSVVRLLYFLVSRR
jgi:hypothetical protein